MTTSKEKSIFSKIIDAANNHVTTIATLEAITKTTKIAIEDITKIAETLNKLAVLVHQHNKAIQDILTMQEIIVNHLKMNVIDKKNIPKKEDLN